MFWHIYNSYFKSEQCIISVLGIYSKSILWFNFSKYSVCRNKKLLHPLILLIDLSYSDLSVLAKTFSKKKSKEAGKHLYQSLFFNKASTLLKKRRWHRCFSGNFAKFLRTPFLPVHPRWLRLKSNITVIPPFCVFLFALLRI